MTSSRPKADGGRAWRSARTSTKRRATRSRCPTSAMAWKSPRSRHPFQHEQLEVAGWKPTKDGVGTPRRVSAEMTAASGPGRRPGPTPTAESRAPYEQLRGPVGPDDVDRPQGAGGAPNGVTTGSPPPTRPAIQSRASDPRTGTAAPGAVRGEASRSSRPPTARSVASPGMAGAANPSIERALEKSFIDRSPSMNTTPAPLVPRPWASARRKASRSGNHSMATPSKSPEPRPEASAAALVCVTSAWSWW